MHLVYLGYHYDEGLKNSRALLDSYRTISPWCEAVRRSGATTVTVVQRFHAEEEFEKDGVSYLFVNDGRPAALKPWRNLTRLHSLVASLHPDIVHVNGGTFQLRRLRKKLPSETAVVWQHHGGLPPSAVKRIGYRFAVRCLDGLLFAAEELAGQWRDAGIVNSRMALHQVMEGSSKFIPQPVERARESLGLRGSPIFLWVGRLNANKDPVTIVRGFSEICRAMTDAHLYMIFHEDGLLGEVRKTLASLGLSHRVHLVGKVEHRQLGQWHSAADFFVLGSHQEGSGFALLEALACGAIPLVTDIPSFRCITGNGAIGALWCAGDPDSFARAARAAQLARASRTSVRSFFEMKWSYDEIGKSAVDAYRQAIIRRRRSIDSGNRLS